MQRPEGDTPSGTPLREPALVSRIAEVTSHRDRDALDRAVVGLLMEFLQAHAVTLYRCIHHGTVPRLARRVVARLGQVTDEGDAETDVAELPELDADARWRECVSRREVVHEAGRTLFPIEGEREVIGLLEMCGTSKPSARDLQLVSGMLSILRNQFALLDYGERDTLTGLLNRKTFETHFAKLRTLASLRAVSKEQSRGWLGLLDIDHFKAINDRFGHIFGDEVLLLLSRIMKQTFRAGDQLFRFGGEEFVAVLAGTDAEGAGCAFERLRAAVEAFQFPQVGRVTISLGYTAIVANDTPTTAIERADAALYYVKRNGRNNVRQHEALVATGDVSNDQDSGDVELF